MPMYLKLDGIDGESKATSGGARGETKVFTFENDLETKGFNPQPEPPAAEQDMFVSDLEMKGFNPQPEPPADVADDFGDMLIF